MRGVNKWTRVMAAFLLMVGLKTLLWVPVPVGKDGISHRWPGPTWKHSRSVRFSEPAVLDRLHVQVKKAKEQGVPGQAVRGPPSSRQEEQEQDVAHPRPLSFRVVSSEPAAVDRVRAEDVDPSRARAFLGLEFCKLGWGGARCSVELPRPACPELDARCFEHPEYGVVSVPHELWLAAQRLREGEGEAAEPDYAARNRVHQAAFRNFTALPAELGDVAQLLGGPFPLLADMLAAGHSAASVTLLEPRALRYLDAWHPERSAFALGHLAGRGVNATSIVALPLADAPAPAHRFDTVVMVGALAAVPDAYDALEHAYRVLRPGGLFVWHEALWDGARGVPAGATGGRIRLKPAFARRFTAVFDTLYDSRGDGGVYFIGRKRAEDGLPPPPPLPPPLTVGGGGAGLQRAEEGQVTVVLLTHARSKRVQLLHQSLERYMAMPIVRHILLLLNGADVPFDVAPFEGKLILKAFAHNSMNNRLRIAGEVATEAVLWMDDDVVVEEEAVRCLYRTWVGQPDRVLGLDPKGIQYASLRYIANYDFRRHSGYSYVAGNTMLFHHSYLDAYLADERLVRWVHPERWDRPYDSTALRRADDEVHFCEDLALVALVANATGKPPLVVERIKGAVRGVGVKEGLSLAGGWWTMRARCIIWLEGHFGMTVSPTEKRRQSCSAPRELATSTEQ